MKSLSLFEFDTWAKSAAEAIRRCDPEQREKHVLWVDGHARGDEALLALKAELGGRYVPRLHVLRLASGGEVRSEIPRSLGDCCVGVWLSRRPAPSDLELRLQTGQYSEVWVPVCGDAQTTTGEA